MDLPRIAYCCHLLGDIVGECFLVVVCGCIFGEVLNPLFRLMLESSLISRSSKLPPLLGGLVIILVGLTVLCWEELRGLAAETLWLCLLLGFDELLIPAFRRCIAATALFLADIGGTGLLGDADIALVDDVATTEGPLTMSSFLVSIIDSVEVSADASLRVTEVLLTQ